jgi:hypothetical protein
MYVYCWYNSFIMEQPMNVITLHPQEEQEKWRVMAVVTGNCRVVVLDFKGHCMLDKADVDRTV